MKNEWNLEKLYKDFSDIQFQNDLEKMQSLAKQATKLSIELQSENEINNLLKIKHILEQKETVFKNISTYAYLRQCTNVSDADCISYLNTIKIINASMTDATTTFYKYISSIDNLDLVIDSSYELKEIKWFFTEIKNKYNYILSNEAEGIISKFNISGADSWSYLQSYLTSSVNVDYNNENVTLSYIRSLAYSNNKNIRKAAYEAELKSYEKIKLPISFALNSIKLQVINECKARGFKSPLYKTLFEAKLKEETLDSMLQAIKEYLPKFRHYLKIKAKTLGHKKGLPWYDLFAPIGTNNKQYTITDTEKIIIKIFKYFSNDLCELAQNAFDNSWIDFLPKNNKISGAFCSNIHTIGESRILTNFTGSFSDIVDLAHELGHAYHNFIIKDNNILLTKYSMPVSETASIFNENLVMDYAIENAEDDEEKLFLVENKLQGASLLICDVYSSFLFESKIFEKREQSFMLPDALCNIMVESQKLAYGDSLDDSYLHPYMWAYMSHFYSSELSFYNFPYAFGELFSKGLYEIYKEEGKDFLTKYRALLKSTTTMSVEDVAKTANIDITKKDFWEKALMSYCKQIDLFEDLAKKVYNL